MESINQQNWQKSKRRLSERQCQIFESIELEVLYKTEEIVEKIGLKGARTRELLKEMVAMGRLTCIVATKNRRYIRVNDISMQRKDRRYGKIHF